MSRGEFPLAEAALNGIARKMEAIRHAQGEIAELEAVLDVCGYDPSRVRTKGRRSRDRLADSLHRLAVRRDELSCLVDDYVAQLRRADALIDRIEDEKLAQFVSMRFFEGKTYKEIGRSMHYSEDHVRARVSRKAMAAVEELIAAFEL